MHNSSLLNLIVIEAVFFWYYYSFFEQTGTEQGVYLMSCFGRCNICFHLFQGIFRSHHLCWRGSERDC